MADEYSDIDLMDLLARFLRNGKKILLWVAISAVIGLVIGFSIPKTYTVKSKLAPEIAQKSNSGISSLAALAGINTNSMTVTDAMYPDLYPEIIKSIPFRIELLNMPVKVMHKDEVVETDLYDYAINYVKHPWWTYVIKAPGKALSWMIGLLVPRSEPKHGYENIDSFHLTREQGRALNNIANFLTVEVEKKTFVISVAAETQDPVISADLCSRVIDNLQKYVVNYRTEKSRHDLDYYMELNESARKEYFDAQQRYARYVDSNQGVVLQRVLIERDRLQNEASLKYQVYNTTSQQVQQAKAKVQLETPVFAMLQPPTVPLAPSNTSKAKIMIVAMFLGFLLASFWYLWGKTIWAKICSLNKTSEKD